MDGASRQRERAVVAWLAGVREALVPLPGRIAATDALNDRIAYALYSLTYEEVAVVEGRHKVKSLRR